MKLKLLFVLLFFYNLSSSQDYKFGKLELILNKSESVVDYDGMKKIIIDKSDNNIVIINKFPNQSLPNVENSKYNNAQSKNDILEIVGVMIEKTIDVKTNDLTSATLISDPQIIYSGNIYIIAYTILNSVKKTGEKFREIYLLIPNRDDSYLIITTSFKENATFSKRFQEILNTLKIKN